VYFFASDFQYCSISCAILLASNDAPINPRFVKPAAYRPRSPFQPLGKGMFGNPSFPEKNSLSCQAHHYSQTLSVKRQPSTQQETHFILITKRGTTISYLLDPIKSYLKPRGHVAFVAGGENDGIKILQSPVHKLCPMSRQSLYCWPHLQCARQTKMVSACPHYP